VAIIWPLASKAKRHFTKWASMSVDAMVGQEELQKLGSVVTRDVKRPLQAYDAGGGHGGQSVLKAQAEPRAAGIDPALNFVPFSGHFAY
jgi:hypothetical protein